ncbi:unnamed protein product [Spirodela intermedia]|uniref:Uncharacterized protein n=1 Tax=Spirodela intermedia TaxID=51605 RepID=A0A7I8KYT8_SPIIN|nr:unnamed protein product [Spirodela intermedia]
MGSNFHELPPSKRFKLLHRQEPPQQPSAPPSAACLPAKKRIESHRLHLRPEQHKPEPDLPYSCCLPAKKRIWAPHPLLPFPPDAVEDDEPSKFIAPMKPKEEDQEGEKEDEEEEEEEEEEEDDGVVCAVCKSTDAHPQDPIVFCDGCELMVHASCYGNPLARGVPEGDWFCERCENKEESTECCLCTAKGGATKRTTDGRWAHILCALLVPEAFFHDGEGREGLDLSRVPARRWEGACYACGSSEGCVVDCSEARCGLAFHASCAVDADLCIEYREGRGGGIVVGFCHAHTQLWKKQQVTGKFKFVPQQKEFLKGKARD